MGFIGVPARIRSIWIFLSTLGMAYFVLSPVSYLFQGLIFFLWEYAITFSYLKYRGSIDFGPALTPDEPLRKNKTWVFYLAIIASILPLIIVKFSPSLDISLLPNFVGNFDAKSTQGVLSVGFLGISYLTFRIVGIIMEVRDGLIHEIHIDEFVSYILFFPTLASGPIDRYRRFLKDLREPITRKEYNTYFVEGVEYFFRALLYKFIIAYLIDKYAMTPLSNAQGWLPVGNICIHIVLIYFLILLVIVHLLLV